MLMIKIMTIVLLAIGMGIIYMSALRSKGVLAVAEGSFEDECTDNAVSTINFVLGILLVCVAAAAMLI